MTQSQSDELFEAIRKLPAGERLRLVERVVHELAEAKIRSAISPNAVLGLFANEPELMDEVVEDAMEARARDPLRRTDA